MHKIIFSFSILLSGLSASAEQIKTVSVQDKVFVPASSSAKIVLSPKGIASLVESDKGVLVVPKKSGRVSVYVDTKLHQFEFVDPATVKFVEGLDDYFKNRMGLTMDYDSGQVRITGRLHRVRDLIDLADLARKSGADYQFKAMVDSDIQDRLESHLKSILDAGQIGTFQINFQPHLQVFLSNQKGNHLSNAENLLKPFGVKPVVSGELLSLEPLVQVTVTVAEVSKNAQEDLGIDWPTEATFQLSPKFLTEGALQATLKAAVAKGQAQILATPRLVAKSGGTAEFLAGGEFPIRISERGKKDIFWKKHGIYLKIKPKADRKGQLQLDLQAEISMPEPSYEGETVPALKTNRLSSQFDLESSRTIVLSGLVQNLRSSSSSGPFGLSDLPVLGRLFRSQSFQNHQSELVIFVTPILVVDNDQLKPKLPEGIDSNVSAGQ